MENAISNLINKQTTTGVASSGGIITPTQYYPELLTTNGWLMPYAEWIKVIGAIYIVILIYKAAVKPFFKLIFTLVKRICHGRSPKENEKTKK